jgi:hypothetical protein
LRRNPRRHQPRPGPAGLLLSGLPAVTLRETRDRIRAAILNSGEARPSGAITVALTPASLSKCGAAGAMSRRSQPSWPTTSWMQATCSRPTPRLAALPAELYLWNVQSQRRHPAALIGMVP